MTNDFRFDITRPERVIDLLVSELYAGDPDVSIREAIQNARDANHAFTHLTAGLRSAVGDGDYQPHIGIWQDGRSIRISDNGVGMTEDDVRSQLLDIGVTRKAQVAENQTETNVTSPRVSQKGYIGKYGVGVLGYFILASKATFYTRSHAEAGEDWIRLECSFGSNKSVSLTHVSFEQIKASIPKGHPLASKPSSQAHGTIVDLEVRSSGHGDQSFQDRLNALRKSENVAEAINRYCYFLDQEVVAYSDHAPKPLAVVLQDEYDDPGFLTELCDHIDNHRGRNQALDQLHVELEIEGLDESAHLFLFLRDDLTFEHYGFSVYVDGLLVEENAKDLRPFWAKFIHGVVTLSGAATSLDRRALGRNNAVFHRLREQMENQIIDAVRNFLTNKNKEFLKDLWPVLEGNFIPSLLQAMVARIGQDEKRQAERVIRELGLLLPVPVIRAPRSVSRESGDSRYATRGVILQQIIDSKQKQRQDMDDAGIVSITYIQDAGSAEAVVSQRQQYVIDAVQRPGERGSFWAEYLNKLGELHGDLVCFTEWKEEEDIRPFEGDACHKGWVLLRERLETMMKYRGSDFVEEYNVGLFTFEPAEFPVLLVEKKVREGEVQALRDALSSIEAQAGGAVVKEMLGLLDGKRGQDRTLQAFVNANNPVMQQIAEQVNRLGRTVPFHDNLLYQIIENARVDHYGGRFIGQDALQFVYSSVRNPWMLMLLDLGECESNLSTQWDADVQKFLDRIREEDLPVQEAAGQEAVERVLLAIKKFHSMILRA